MQPRRAFSRYPFAGHITNKSLIQSKGYLLSLAAFLCRARAELAVASIDRQTDSRTCGCILLQAIIAMDS